MQLTKDMVGCLWLMPRHTSQGQKRFLVAETIKIVIEFLKILIWPTIVLVLVIMFRRQMNGLLLRLSKIHLPGGGSLDFNEKIKEAQRISEQVEQMPTPEDKKDVPRIPLTEANKKMLDYGLQPSPSGLDMGYYRSLARQDPNLALAGLRIEIDILAKNLAKGFKVDILPTDTGAKLLAKLYHKKAITDNQRQLALRVLQLCNEAIHGQKVSVSEADNVIDIADILRDQYVSWLSWGFQ